jgi:phenylalanine-4-hydroxylase
MESNEILDNLPKHLMDFVIDQPYNSYTAQDHALWRYVMRQNVDYLKEVAHSSYMDGLQATGISINQIPHMYGMNRILSEIGWAACAVDGFIPPAAFMEFQAYNVLVIAADIRPIDQIEYTPAPDIIHEAAGHAPIIANEEYSEYLRLFGELGSKAFSSAKDYELYEAIRHLSILKAYPYTKQEEIDKAQEKLVNLEKNLGEPSEMSLIRNLHWWTVEYGLIGDLDNPKIYGAGLLSSIGESYWCLQDHVKKLPYTIDAVNYGFDITKPQPQLFVTPDFANLAKVLYEFADRMALRRGGLYGLKQAVNSGNVSTCVYSSGLQVSGIFSEVLDDGSDPIYLRTKGGSQLALGNTEIEGHGQDYHSEGFGSPVGVLKDVEVPLEKLSDVRLRDYGIAKGRMVKLKFLSGVVVTGKLVSTLRRNGNLVLMTFDECTVKYKDQILFEPSWGKYDMAVGDAIVSCYNGPADANAYPLQYPVPNEKTHKINYDENAKRIHSLYKAVKDIRDNEYSSDKLQAIWQEAKQKFPQEWLLALEILELANKHNEDIKKEVLGHLEILKSKKEFKNLIENGLKLAQTKA